MPPPGRDLTCALAPPVQQGSLKNGTATRSLASERAFGSLGRWLENLPKDLYSSAKAEAVAGSPFSWNYPCR